MLRPSIAPAKRKTHFPDESRLRCSKRSNSKNILRSEETGDPKKVDIESTGLMKLPDELFLRILKEADLKPRQLVALQKINRRFMYIARDASLWRPWTPAEGPVLPHNQEVHGSFFGVFCAYIRQTLPNTESPKGSPDICARLLGEKPFSSLGSDFLASSRLAIETQLWHEPVFTMPLLPINWQTSVSYQKRAAYALMQGRARTSCIDASTKLPVEFAGADLLTSATFAKEVVGLFGPSFLALDEHLRANRSLALTALARWPAHKSSGSGCKRREQSYFSAKEAETYVDQSLCIRFFRSLTSGLKKDLEIQHKLIEHDPRTIVELLRENNECNLQFDRPRLLQAAASLPYFYALKEMQAWREDREIAMTHFAHHPLSVAFHLTDAMANHTPWLHALINREPKCYRHLPVTFRNKKVLSGISDPFTRFLKLADSSKISQLDTSFILETAKQAARVDERDKVFDKNWLKSFSISLKNNTSLLSTLISFRPYLYAGLSRRMKAEPCIYRVALEKCPDLITQIPSEIYDDTTHILSALARRPHLAQKLPLDLRLNAPLLGGFLPDSRGHSIILWSENSFLSTAPIRQQKLWLLGVSHADFVHPLHRPPFGEPNAIDKYAILCELSERLGNFPILVLMLPLVAFAIDSRFSSKITHRFQNALKGIIFCRRNLSTHRKALLLERSLTTPSSFTSRKKTDAWLTEYRKFCLSVLFEEISVLR